MTKDEALKLARRTLYENTCYSRHGDPVEYQDKRNDDSIKILEEALAQPNRQPMTDDEIETLIQTKHFRPGYVKHRSDLVILDWYRLGLRDGEAAHGIGKKT
jgi:hypothetical protein